MRDLISNFAWSAFASPPGGGWRLVFLYVLSCSLLLSANGCSWLGSGSSGDPTILKDGGNASAEEIAVALAATRDEMRRAPDEPYWPFHLGQIYGAVDSTAQAVSHLQTALIVDPGYAPAAALLSKIYYEAERYDVAVVLLDDFLSQNPAAPDALRAALALHLEATDDLERAEAVLRECSDDSDEVRAAKTFVSLRGNDLDSVLETAGRAVDANPKSAANHNNYGIALLYAGRPIEARKAFEKALDLNDKLPGALYNMAIVEAFYFFDEEKGKKWFERYRQYANDDPDDLTSVFSAAVSLKRERPE